MAQFYSLDEAARVLGMGPEELAAKAQAREVRAFMDSGSWQFRVADIDELARRRGMGSDPDLSLSDLDLVAQPPGDDMDLDLSELELGVTRPDLGPETGELSELSSSDIDIEVDSRNLPPLTNSSSTIIGMGHKGKSPSDSDVRLMPESGMGASDSDVRLAPAGGGPSSSDVRLAPEASDLSTSDIRLAPAGGGPSSSDVRLAPEASDLSTSDIRLAPPVVGGPGDSDVTLVSDDDLGPVSQSSDAFPISPGDTGFGEGPKLGSSEEVAALDDPSSLIPDSDSDFELTPSSVIDALQPESGSDFELSALDASDEFEATPLRGPSDSDVTAADPATSGINLGRPSDSGINLQGVGGMGLYDQADSIELAPLDDSGQMPTPAPRSSPKATPAPAAKKVEKDIFEDTDFEVDALDADNTDQTVQLEAGSDYDISDDDDVDSGSEVFAVDEEDVDQNAATAMASGIMVGDDEDEEDEDSGESASAWDIDSEAGGEDEPIAARASASAASSPSMITGGAGAEWGGIWVGLLGVATVLMLLLAFVSLDLVRNLYDYRGDMPVSSGLVHMLAGLAGGS